MMNTAVIGLIAGILLVVQSRQIPPFRNDDNDGEIWAVLVAGSNSWWNYRHQADICHAYHILRNHGIPEDHIITMMYDDIAHNEENPYKGKIFNHPNGSDVYAGVKIDYTGDDVNPENFLKVLKGEHNGGNRVLNSTEKDRVFVYFSDHGGPGILSFPSDSLTVKDLSATLHEIHAKNSYKELVLYVEACYSGSMFQGFLPKNTNIYAVTAANAAESSYACYCDSKKLRGVCLGDLFSVNWMEDSDREDIEKETLSTQFDIVKKETADSHVMKFGDLHFVSEPVGDFQGREEYINKSLAVPRGSANNYAKWRSTDVPIKMLEAKLQRVNSADEQQDIEDQIEEITQKRNVFRFHFNAFIKKLVNDPINRRNVLRNKGEPIKNLECHDAVFKAFNRICYNIAKNPYVIDHLHALNNMCNRKIPTQRIIDEMMDHCLDTPVQFVL
ncbi:unnamed protein product [Bursaphelenchus xylophilus]|uniref:legumain n=1 Tax=Bursaphelenchus xylophilus TaxID=6326 RepID=A0A1I7SLF6_BURXY|nr:unnamed protein product [Bursaphelenchus xylophilus]CAG9129561.1 unnamed protein product [Bursaphelenchus xylophilus]